MINAQKTERSGSHRLIVTGNSGHLEKSSVSREIETYLQCYGVQGPVEIITGMLGSVDSQAQDVANARRWKCLRLSPPSRDVCRRELYRRNERMASLASGLLLFVDELDTLHRHLLDAAYFHKLNLRVIRPPINRSCPVRNGSSSHLTQLQHESSRVSKITESLR